MKAMFGPGWKVLRNLCEVITGMSEEDHRNLEKFRRYQQEVSFRDLEAAITVVEDEIFAKDELLEEGWLFITSNEALPSYAWPVLMGLLVRDKIGKGSFTIEHYITLTKTWKQIQPICIPAKSQSRELQAMS